MKKVLVVGGGLSGLSAASILANNNYNVTLLEASPKLGGRTFSYFDKASNLYLDNGQHLLMGCYTHTLKFIDLINAKDQFHIQENFEVNFKTPTENHVLKTDKVLSNFSLVISILKFPLLALTERINIIRLFIKLFYVSSSNKTIYEWLLKEKQSSNAIKIFWEPIAVSALNSDIKIASAETFISILKQVILSGKKGNRFIIPETSLTESFCNTSECFLKKNNSVIKLNEKVEEISLNGSKVTSIKSDKQTYTDFDYVVLAVPPFALERLLPINIKPDYSSILTFHVFVDDNPLTEKFYNLVESPVHWVFNHKEYLTLVISSADNYMQQSINDLEELAKSELNKYFNIKVNSITRIVTIKNKRACFIPTSDFEKKRKNFNINYNNLFIAGDWIDTDLPSTIESAVKSGYIAAGKVMQSQ